jgi:hypothetical protein
MKPLIKAALVAVLLMAAPAWAHGGHGSWWDGHRHHPRSWQKGHHKQYSHHRHSYETRRVEHVYRYEPYPVPSAAASPGIHVIFPDVYFPWPQ